MSNCSICNKLYDEDETRRIKLPTCGHESCNECLVITDISVSVNGTTIQFQCPTCGSSHTTSRRGETRHSQSSDYNDWDEYRYSDDYRNSSWWSVLVDNGGTITIVLGIVLLGVAVAWPTREKPAPKPGRRSTSQPTGREPPPPEHRPKPQVHRRNKKLQAYYRGFRPVTQFGSYGNGEREFDGVTQLVASQDTGLIYIVDKWNNRVLIKNNKFEPVGMFGGIGSEEGKMAYPTGIGISKVGTIHVTDSQNKRVQLWNKRGQHLMAIETTQEPDHLALDNKGRLYVSSNSEINLYTSQHKHVKLVKKLNNKLDVKAMVVDKDRIVVSTFYGDLYFMSTSGQVLKVVLASDSTFGAVISMAFDPWGNLILAEAGGLTVLDKSDDLVTHIPIPSLENPRGITVTRNNEILVSDFNQNSVIVLKSRAPCPFERL